jgi:hypothetical protein
VLATLAAQAVAPGVSRKPSVLQRGLARVPEARCARKGNDLKLHSFGVPENEFVSAVIGEPILVVGDTIQTPGAQPATSHVFNGRSRPCISQRKGVQSCCGLRVHTKDYDPEEHMVKQVGSTRLFSLVHIATGNWPGRIATKQVSGPIHY